MKYLSVLDDIKSGIFCRQDILEAFLKIDPEYNIASFNRHFSRLAFSGYIENVGENLYIKVTADTARKFYKYKDSSMEMAAVESFLGKEFPLADFIVFETVKLNEFFIHQIAQNTIIVMVERMLMDAVFEELNEKFPSVMFAPTIEEISRYGIDCSIIIVKLHTRYPKNTKQKRGYSIEKLIVDLFAEKVLEAFLNQDDYPAALETAFKQYRINETRLFNYAKSRRVDTEIRTMIRDKTGIKLYTDKENT